MKLFLTWILKPPSAFTIAMFGAMVYGALVLAITGTIIEIANNPTVTIIAGFLALAILALSLFGLWIYILWSLFTTKEVHHEA
jgi:hypothetical protein